CASLPLCARQSVINCCCRAEISATRARPNWLILRAVRHCRSRTPKGCAVDTDACGLIGSPSFCPAVYPTVRATTITSQVIETVLDTRYPSSPIPRTRSLWHNPEDKRGIERPGNNGK